MATTRLVDMYSADEGQYFKVREEDLRKVAATELGMTAGPFELNLFTKTILATALQREQIERNDALKKVMTAGGDWKNAMKAVTAVTDLMEALGIDDASWSPEGSEVVGITPLPEPPVKPDTGQQAALNLDGQAELEL
jgi:hypothetical protein